MPLTDKLKTILGSRDSFRRNSLIMSFGSIVKIAIGLALYPVVTRLYSKADFGEFSVYVALISFIALAGTALYPSGLVIPKHKREFLALAKLSFLLCVATTGGASFLTFTLGDTVISIFKLHTFGQYIYLVPLGVFMTCCYQIFLNWNVRDKNFSLNAKASIASAISSKFMSIGFALLFASSAAGLVLSHLISVLVSIKYLGMTTMLRKMRIFKRISSAEVKNVAIKYHRYPKLLLPANLLNQYTSDLPVYALTYYFSPSITGAFFLANTMLAIPLDVIGSSISSVFLQRANELFHENRTKMAQFAAIIHKKLLYFGVFAFGFIFGFGELIFPFVFGDDWLLAGQIASILSIYYVYKLVSGPLAKIYRVVGRESYSLGISIVLAILRTSGMALGVISGDALTAIIYFTIANLLGYFINTVLVFKALELPPLRPLLESVIVVCVVFTAFYMGKLVTVELIN